MSANELIELFKNVLKEEMNKIVRFYNSKGEQLKSEIVQWNNYVLEIESSEDVPSPEKPEYYAQSVHFWARPDMSDTVEDVYVNLAALYANAYDLMHFVQLNKTGIDKILKKFDKLTGQRLRQELQGEVATKMGSMDTSVAQAIQEDVKKLFSRVVTHGDERQGHRMLDTKLRPHLNYDRDVIWREMAEAEHMQHTLRLNNPRDLMRKKNFAYYANKYGMRFLLGCVALLVMTAILMMPTFLQTAEQQRCLAVLVFVLMLWIMEVVDLYVTALVVPLLTVLFGLADHPSEGLSPGQVRTAALTEVLSVMWTDTITLLLGGFTIAAALSKTNLAKMFASRVISQFKDSVRGILLGSMMLAALLSMFISNVAAPVLLYSVVEPILRTYDANSPISQALVLGIAFASNVGGMMSPIASPQNVFAVAYMSVDGGQPGWGIWLLIAVPVAATSIFGIWLYMTYAKFTALKNPQIRPLSAVDEKIGPKHMYTLLISALAIGLWLANRQLVHLFGGMGLTAFIPIIALFGGGVLGKEDLRNFPWDVVFLAMGGLVLGKAVKDTGLLDYLVASITPYIDEMPLMAVFATIMALNAVAATFISHTVAAIVIVPVAAQIGRSLGHQNLLVMGTALMCSGSMALQISGFPNMIASNKVDGLGRRYAQKREVLHYGTVSTLMVYLVICVPAFFLMKAAFGTEAKAAAEWLHLDVRQEV